MKRGWYGRCELALRLIKTLEWLSRRRSRRAFSQAELGELAAELGVTLRTVYRDLDAIRQAGIDVPYARFTGRRAA